jgi:two-component system probable response regulator PhcQ
MSLAKNRGTILFVDDEPNITAAFKRTLRSQPYELLSSTSAEDALQILEDRPVDVVVSDEQMPGMSGSEFLAEVRVRKPTTIRIILSGHASVDAALRAINQGEVYRFLTKPCSPTDLIGTIHQALAYKKLQALSLRLLRDYRRQADLIDAAERISPAIRQLETDMDGAILVDDTDADGAIPDLLTEIEREMDRSRRQRRF